MEILLVMNVCYFYCDNYGHADKMIQRQDKFYQWNETTRKNNPVIGSVGYHYPGRTKEPVVLPSGFTFMSVMYRHTSKILRI